MRRRRHCRHCRNSQHHGRLSLCCRSPQRRTRTACPARFANTRRFLFRTTFAMSSTSRECTTLSSGSLPFFHRQRVALFTSLSAGRWKSRMGKKTMEPRSFCMKRKKRPIAHFTKKRFQNRCIKMCKYKPLSVDCRADVPRTEKRMHHHCLDSL